MNVVADPDFTNRSANLWVCADTDWTRKRFHPNRIGIRIGPDQRDAVSLDSGWILRRWRKRFELVVKVLPHSQINALGCDGYF